jgi:KDO2-lipid IV(A) lauroyltransferase
MRKNYFWRNLAYRLGLGLVWALSFLPWAWQQGLGRALGYGLKHLLTRRRHIVAVNLQLAFAKESPSWREKLLKEHFSALGIGIFELAQAFWHPDAHLPKYRLHGLEHWQAVRDKGIILLGLHMTTQELIGRLLHRHLSYGVVYRRQENLFLEQFLLKHRQKIYQFCLPREATTSMIKHLRRGAAIWYAPDQSLKGKFSILSNFFGEPAATNIALGRLAVLGQAVVLPCAGRRQADGSYDIVFYPAQDFAQLDNQAMADYLNQVFMAYIQAAPEQYFWVHRKFKHRPGLPDVYQKKI